jgi:hypothetical protein
MADVGAAAADAEALHARLRAYTGDRALAAYVSERAGHETDLPEIRGMTRVRKRSRRSELGR